jgi:predicted anti-sigma-YlaC factor YlaD
MTCAEVRELLPDHVLAMATDLQDAEVRRHLRGCASCRAELAALQDGLEIFSESVPRTDPPGDLKDRVLTTLDDEWRETPAPPSRGSRFVGSWLVAAAATLLLVVSVVWGVGHARRADRAEVGATSYSRLLSTLGGTEFRVGALRGVGGEDVRGSVLLYDSVWGRSWAAVFVKTSRPSDELSATLTGPGGFSLPFERLWGEEGEADGWLVTEDDLRSVDRLTLRDADGNAIAAARISDA